MGQAQRIGALSTWRGDSIKQILLFQWAHLRYSKDKGATVAAPLEPIEFLLYPSKPSGDSMSMRGLVLGLGIFVAIIVLWASMS